MEGAANFELSRAGFVVVDAVSLLECSPAARLLRTRAQTGTRVRENAFEHIRFNPAVEQKPWSEAEPKHKPCLALPCAFGLGHAGATPRADGLRCLCEKRSSPREAVFAHVELAALDDGVVLSLVTKRHGLRLSTRMAHAIMEPLHLFDHRERVVVFQ